MMCDGVMRLVVHISFPTRQFGNPRHAHKGAVHGANGGAEGLGIALALKSHPKGGGYSRLGPAKSADDH
jgi:hypothetical protein